jgi:excisionase family DNA binding protein
MGTGNADEQNWSEKLVFSTGEAALLCNVSQQTIIRCFDSGRLQGFRVPGSKFRRIPREELVRFMRENNIPLGVIEGGQRRVLCILAEASPMKALASALDAHARIELRRASTAFEAGVLAVHFRPHLILHEAGFDALPLAVLSRTMQEIAGGDRPRVVSVGGEDAARARLLDDGADEVIPLVKDTVRMTQRVLELLSDPAD